MSAPTTPDLHVDVRLDELAQITGATLTGQHGGQARVTGEAYPSAVMPGMWAVETEIGTLYLDEDLPVTIVNPAIDDDVDALATAVGVLTTA